MEIVFEYFNIEHEGGIIAMETFMKIGFIWCACLVGSREFAKEMKMIF